MLKDFEISVLIRTRNSSKTLVRCIESIYSQTIKVIEIIIVDSGSTDDTKEIALKYGATIIDYPIELQSFNYSKALNIGIEKCKGQIILILSSHVWFHFSETLKSMKSLLLADTLIKAVSIARDKYPEIRLCEEKKIKQVFINKNNFQGAGMYNYCSLIRKNDWEQYNFNELIPTCEDQEWILYWMNKIDAISVIVMNPVVGYNNPYYNFKKDLQEYYISGKYIYPYYKTFRFIIFLYKKSLRYFLNKNLGKFIYYFRLASNLLKYKLFTPNKIESNSFLLKK